MADSLQIAGKNGVGSPQGMANQRNEQPTPSRNGRFFPHRPSPAQKKGQLPKLTPYLKNSDKRGLIIQRLTHRPQQIMRHKRLMQEMFLPRMRRLQ